MTMNTQLQHISLSKPTAERTRANLRHIQTLSIVVAGRLI